MRKIVSYSALLIAGLLLSQVFPALLGDTYALAAEAIRVLTMIGLAFIMIHVGFEFHIDKSRLRAYGWDYLVAFTAAFFPWILVTGYFLFVMLPPDVWGEFDAWKETLLAGRFAASTSAGVLFGMLAAADLGATWVFRKARILAIFDDLDTVLLMIPLKILMVGLAWQLGMVVVVMAAQLVIAYVWLRRVRLPLTWPWMLAYAATIVGVTELVHAGSKLVDPSVPIHIEVLLPAFVLGCVVRPRWRESTEEETSVEGELHAILERPAERRAATAVSAAFMALVGLSMPAILEGSDAQHLTPSPTSLHLAAPSSAVDDPALHGGTEVDRYSATISARQPSLPWSQIVLHVVMITLLSNLGKMFAALCYREQAHWRQRLAVAIGLWPRGEVGAGILVLSLSYGIGGPIVTVAVLSLAVNLALTGAFIVAIKRLIEGSPEIGQPELRVENGSLH